MAPLCLSLERRAHGRADRAADVERCCSPRLLRLQLLGSFAEQLQRGPPHHGDAGCANRMALRNESAGSIDGAVTVDRGLAIVPVFSALAGLRLSDDLGANCTHHTKAIVYFGDVYVLWPQARHLVGLVHCFVSTGWTQNVTSCLLQWIGRLRETGDLNALRLRHTEFAQSF